MVDAINALDKVTSVVSWTGLILRYVASGQQMLALRLFAAMQAEGVAPDSRTFVAAFRACTGLAAGHGYGALEAGKKIHHQVSIAGCDTNPFVEVRSLQRCGMERNDLWLREQPPGRKSTGSLLKHGQRETL
ncbi:pentatricopeptide repeat-containing protein At1g05750, chloroplastic-like [Selaginella moellendorffii]|uniref:pentatricopeptide repeat-containing protein At1g05750, chloroplastic-like n=1 Tax=Selaginella moellendorffii TaxID=88036 RepID=UPI000D1CFE65|nr:pentatricopeptide repeat-containing protein At1g05750, chloroplastic-like [Selaginella moellendorffii]|eukprot:XP_024519050.1 pentatricopeptide repeat-containing protein At1g05750, chloroplastic-like [Selaginella moellendorffii]